MIYLKSEAPVGHTKCAVSFTGCLPKSEEAEDSFIYMFVVGLCQSYYVASDDWITAYNELRRMWKVT
jgi:hypothetical protein